MEMDDTQKVYGSLYDIASENMKNSGGDFEFSRDAFIFATQCVPGQAELLQMNDMDNMSFIQSAYVSFFYRTCDAEAYKRWNGEKGLPEAEFRKKCITSLSRSGEFIDKGVTLKNNMYSSTAEANRSVSVINAPAQAGADSPVEKAVNKLYRFYKKFPKPIKNLIRKILGVK